MSADQKKIILISPSFPYRGGIAATTDRLAMEYQKRGRTVEIWTYKKLYPKMLFPGKTQLLDPDKHDAPEGIIIHREIDSTNPLNWIKVGKKLKKENATVIIRYWLPFFAPCLGRIVKHAKNGSNRFICLADNVIPHEKRTGDKTLSTYFFKKMDAFVVMAKRGIDDLQQTFGVEKPVIYSPHPIFDIYGTEVDKTEACEKLNLDPQKKYILFFGLIRKYKGLDLLINAFGEFQEDHPDFQLIIAGESYDNWNDYQKLIDKYQIEDKIIRFNQFIPNEEVKNFFGASEFLALTYHSATQSGVTQIAYSLNLPMLVTDVGDLPNMVPNDKVGQVCERKVGSVKKSLEEMADVSNITRYRENIKTEKKRFEWSILCDKLDELE